MNPLTECPLEHLKAYLDDTLDAALHDPLLNHLDQCEACRERLESSAGSADDWRTARQALMACEVDEDGNFAELSLADSLAKSRIADPLSLLKMLTPSDDPRAAGRIGPFEITGIVGSGGMGLVLKARDPALDRFVAIKILAPHLAASKTARKRFAREACAAAAVSVDAERSIGKLLFVPDGWGFADNEQIVRVPASASGAIRVRFDEAAWKHPSLIQRFVNALHSVVAGRVTIAVLDQSRTDCAIDAGMIVPSSWVEDSVLTSAIEAFVRDQVYFDFLHFHIGPSHHATPRVSENSPESISKLLRRYELLSDLPPIADGVPEELLAELRIKAERAEQLSVEKAKTVRASKTAEPSDDAAIEGLESQLRMAVAAAFNTRQDLQFMEVTSLTIKSKTMARKLNERQTHQSEIIERRMDDLQNLSLSWNIGKSLRSNTQPSPEQLLLQLTKPQQRVYAMEAGNQTVSGLVILNGKPVTGRVRFHLASGDLFEASINESGKFQFEKLRAEKYKVTIAAKFVPAKYSEHTATPLSVEVLAGQANEFTFELVSRP